MAYSTVLIDLLEHISLTSEPVVISWDDAQSWPSGALECLVQSGILVSASSAQSIECNACEHHCFMEVLILEGEGDFTDRAFIVCDVPEMQDQIGRVQIPFERLQQWKISFKQIAGVIARLLGFDGCAKYKPEQSSIRLGMLNSKGGRRWVSIFNQPLELEINGFKVPVSELLYFEDVELVIDNLRINELVNSKSLNKGKAYNPSTDKREARKLATQAKYQDWQDEHVSLQISHPGKSITWYSRKISRLPISQDASSETIRKQLK